MRSKKNNSYFVSSPLTSLTVSAVLTDLEGRGEGGSVVLGGGLGGGGGEVVEGVAGLETVASLVWSVVCGGCGSPVARGRCSYVGCAVVASFQYTFRSEVLLNIEYYYKHPPLGRPCWFCLEVR